MQDGKGSEAGDEALKARLDRLEKALDARRQADDEVKRSEKTAPDGSIGKAMGAGFRVASELAAAILVGTLFGWLIDRWLGTAPIFLMVLMILGIVAGFWNVYRLAARPTGQTSGEKE